jgi:GTP-binding protein
MIAHVIDMGGTEGRDPLCDYEIINNELREYSEILAALPQIVVANKMDMPEAESNLSRFKEAYHLIKVIPIIALLHEGIKEMLNEIVKLLDTLPPKQALNDDLYEFEPQDKTSFEIIREDNANFVVTGGLIDNLARKVSLDDPDSLRFLQRVLKRQGVLDALKEKGARDGATVFMGDIEFEYTE